VQLAGDGGSALAAGPAGHWDIGLYGNLFGAREYQVWVPAGYDDSSRCRCCWCCMAV
jgi:hypothetical protein